MDYAEFDSYRTRFQALGHCRAHENPDTAIEELERVQVVYYPNSARDTHIRVIRPDGNYLCFIVREWDEYPSDERMALLRKFAEVVDFWYRQSESKVL